MKGGGVFCGAAGASACVSLLTFSSLSSGFFLALCPRKGSPEPRRGTLMTVLIYCSTVPHTDRAIFHLIVT